MATLTVYSDNDGRIDATGSSLALARNADLGTTVYTNNTTYENIGEFFFGSYTCYELFMSFDTSTIPSGAFIVSVDLNLRANNAGIITAEARYFDWGSTLTGADWRTPTTAAACPLVASRDFNFDANARYSFTDVAFRSYIQPLAATRIVLMDSRQVTAAITYAGYTVSFGLSEVSGTTDDPYITVVYFSPQYSTPSGDVTDGSWTNEAGSNVNLYASIDETTASDADYIQSSELGAGSDVCEVALAALTDPISSSFHIVRYRYLRSYGTVPINLTVALMQGATQIASWTHTSVDTTAISVEQTLSGAEADAITDYADLRLRFTATVP